MAIWLVLISAAFAAGQNFFMRKSVDTQGSTEQYLPLQLSVSCLFVALLNLNFTQLTVYDPKTVMVGLGLGALLGTFLWALGESLKTGPASLSIALVNSSSVLPAVLMAALFGASLGHPYTIWNLIGSLLVVGGILSTSSLGGGFQDRKKWFLRVVLSLSAFVLFSAGLQWRVLLEQGASHPLVPFTLKAEGGHYFMPAIFLSASLIQWGVYFFSKNRQALARDTLKMAVFGGISNGSSMYFMIWGSLLAFGWQNAVYYPIFSLAVILFCNLWGKILYEEKIPYLPNALCISGLIIGSVQWSGIVSQFFQRGA